MNPKRTGLGSFPSYSPERIRAAERDRDTDEQTERIFRDFKLGLIALVAIALLLLLYFWEGKEGAGNRQGPPGEDCVLSFSIEARRRAEVMAAGPIVVQDTSPATRPAGEPQAHASASMGPVGRTSPAVESSPRTPLGPSSAEAAAARRSGPRLYVAKPGDTLSALAHRFYGRASEWTTIFAANRQMIRRPSDLRAGMRVVIPPQ